MNILRIKKIHNNVEIPRMNSYGIFDIRIHSFHKITDDGIIEHSTETYLMQANSRVIIKTGYSLHIDKFITKLLSVTTRLSCAIKDGLVVLGSQQFNYLNETSKELEVVLYNSSDNVILLKKGYRVAQGMIVQVHESLIKEID